MRDGWVVRRARTAVAMVSVAAAFAVAGTGTLVRADDISNDLDASIDATAETLALNVGGPARTTTLAVTPRGGDGKSGCNLTGATTLTLAVSSSAPGVATVSPSSVTFASCGDTKTLTVEPVAVGTATISVSQTANSTGGTFNLAPATFTANVATAANAAPTVTVGGVAAAATYEIGAVPAATCTVVDPDGPSPTFPATLGAITGPLAAHGLGEQEAACSYTDPGGLVAASSVTYAIVDTTAPVLTAGAPSPAANAAGWHAGAVTVTWTCVDAGVGVATGPAASVLRTDGADQAATATCTDHAGNTAAGSVPGIDIDTTAPAIGSATREPAGVWSAGDVTVTWPCADETSGVVDETVSAVVSGEGADLTASGTCADLAGNTTSADETGIQIDRTAPTITFASRAPEGDGWTSAAVTVTWACADALSGPVSPTVSETVDAEGGDLGATGTCVDLAGNRADATQGGIRIDRTAPTLTLESRTPANASGWNDTAVTVTWTCADAAAGLAEGDEVVTATVATEGADQSVSGSCTDLAGNTATATEGGIDIDTSAPVITRLSRTPANELGWNAGPVTVVWGCADDVSDVLEAELAATLDGEGADQSVSATCTDLAGNTVSDTQDDIDIDRTAPTIAATGRTAANAAGWNDGAVTVTWACADALSGAVSPTVATTVDTEGADQQATGVCADLAGNTASATEGDIDIDLTNPVIELTARPAANAAGWYAGAVDLEWSCTDALSGAVDATLDATLTVEGADQVVTAVCVDLAGNTASDTQGDIDIDRTSPTVGSAAVAPAANAAGWHRSAVTVTWACTDALSGAVDATVSRTLPTEGADQTATGTCTDAAGNAASGTVTGIDIDTTTPGLEWSGVITSGAAYHFGSVPAAPTCAATDALSGPAGCAVSGYSTLVGTHTLTATATDVAGNVTTSTRSYTVLAWRLTGFYQPVDTGGVWNAVKNGSTVPLKFEMFAGSTELTSPTAVDRFTVTSTACPNATTPVDEIEEFLTTGGTALRYDATAGQFVQNWQTPKKAGGCYRVTMTADDGSSITANFKLR